MTKEGSSTPIPGGCHDSREKAERQRRALYANEATQEVTMTSSWSFTPVPNATSSGGNITLTEFLSSGISTAESTVSAAAVLELATAAAAAREWEGVLAIEGLPTSDGRLMRTISWRDLPLSLMVMNVTAPEHNGAKAAGKITHIERQERPDLGPNAVAIVGRGTFANTPDGEDAALMVADEILRGVSIDFGHGPVQILDKDTLAVIADEDVDPSAAMAGQYLISYDAEIMGATLCPFPAFEDANMRIFDVSASRSIVASAFDVRKVLTAAAAGLAPFQPPHAWFFEKETNHPCPLTVTKEGQVYGHLALWGQCHRQSAGRCELAPRSRSGYAYFHTGAITAGNGEKINVGRITVGEGGHASTSPTLGIRGAIEHYDRTGTVGAFVRATDGKHGIWLSGAVRSDCPSNKVRDMEANPPSGDWRDEAGGLELCAALSVPVAGFPVPRYEAAMVASAGAEERIVALIASGYNGKPVLNRAEQRRMGRLVRVARSALS